MTIAPWRGELSTYRGYQLIIDHADILAVAPNGDVACFPSMTRVRHWVRQHAQQLRDQGVKGGGGNNHRTNVDPT